MNDPTPPLGFSERRHVPLRVTAIYALTGSLWILLSNKLVATIAQDLKTFNQLQTYKGWLFVAVTSILLFLVLRLGLRARRQAATHYHQLFDASADALFVLDSQGRILDTNQTAVARYGYSREELLRLTALDLTAPDLREQAPDLIRQALVDGAQFEWRHRRKDGSELPVEIAARPIVLDGKQRILTSAHDITRLVEAEQAQRRAIVESSGYRLAWVGYAQDDEAKSVQPVAQAGFEEGYLATVNITWADSERGRGPTGTAIRRGEPSIARNIPDDLNYAPWRAAAIQRSYASSIALPQIAAGPFRRRAKGFRTWVYILCAAMFLTVAFSPSAIELQSRTVYVGVYQNKPKIFIDENGRAAGIFIELLDEIAAQEEWTVAYVPCEWAACLRALEDGQIDLMPDVAYSPERDEKYDFHKIPVLESWSRVYTSPDTPINEWSELDGKRIAVLQGSIQQAMFEQLVSGFGYKVTIIPADSLEQAFALAADGSADAAIANYLFGDYFYQEYGLLKTTIDFNPVALYYATAKGRNPDLLEAIDRYLEKWIPEPDSPYYATLGHWAERKPAYRVPQYVFWVIGGITGLLLAAAGMILLLRQQVKVRTRNLEHASAELQKSEERFRTLARISPVGIFRTDPNGATTYVNPKWCEVSGLSVNEALGDGWSNAVHPDDREKVSRNWQESAQFHKPSFSDYRFVRPDGTVAWVMGQAVPEMNSENQVIGYVGTITDITERVRAETELRRLNAELEKRVARRTEELNIALRQAQEADRLKSAFLATMSHELRTPLNSIIGFTGIVLQELPGPLNAEQVKQLGMVQKSARHLLALINDVLDISKIEAGQLEIESEPFDVREMVDRAIQTVTPLAEKKGLDLVAEVAPGVGQITSDRRRVEQVLINLANNAVKFTERGEVHVECRVEEGRMVTRVVDTGMGIRPEDMGQLFQTFRQIDSGITRQQEGTGLGLSICKRLVEMLGGEIWAESEWGEGSVFTFTLPIGGQDETQDSRH